MDYILYEKKAKIATITLNRPEKLNSLNGPMQEELAAVIKSASEDNEVKIAKNR
jgi:enoyl-CoA hydratase/carnithine racemase